MQCFYFILTFVHRLHSLFSKLYNSKEFSLKSFFILAYSFFFYRPIIADPFINLLFYIFILYFVSITNILLLYLFIFELFYRKNVYIYYINI